MKFTQWFPGEGKNRGCANARCGVTQTLIICCSKNAWNEDNEVCAFKKIFSERFLKFYNCFER